MKIRLACVAAMAVGATAAHADDGLRGTAPALPSALSANASLYYAALTYGPAGTDPVDIRQIAAEAHLGGQFGPLGIAADLWNGHAKYTFFDKSTTEAAYNGAGLHINRRSAAGLIGALVSVGTSPGGYNATILNTALEAQHDFGPVTLGGQLGYTRTVSSDPSAYSLSWPVGWYVHGIARWFLNEDLMFAGDLGYASFGDRSGQDGNVVRWGGRLEYKLKSVPVSAFVTYHGYRWEQPSQVATTSAVMAGISFIAGDPSLAARYRGPAGLDDRNPFYGVNNPL